MSIKATKNGIEKKFSIVQWGMMPKSKNGWVVIPDEVKEVQKPKEEPKEVKNEIELEAKTSKDLPAAEAVRIIKSLPLESLESFTNGDDRSSIEKAIKKRLNEDKE